MLDRRSFLGSSLAFAALPTMAQTDSSRGIRLRFLGSGGSGWNAELEKGGFRRQSSVLLENRVLIDFTTCGFDHMPAGCRPEVLFQTHSHDDHYEPKAAVRSGVRRVYVHESWLSAARTDLAAAARVLSLPAPEVIPLVFGVPVAEGNLTITAVPANHSTSRITDGVLERTSLFLVEKGPARLLYATDTSGIPGDATRMIGIDPHVTDENLHRYRGAVHRPQPITALVMEATDGNDDDNFRMFVHSSVQTVERTVTALAKSGRYTPPPGQSAYLTHLGLRYRNWPSPKIDAELPAPLKSAYDGLELMLG